MYKRRSELDKIMEILKRWKFEENEDKYKNMIFDVIMPEKIVTDKCIPIFEKSALENENPFLNRI